MEPYIGEIRLWGGNFAPLGWALCQGGMLPISENEALFNLIGTTYGGDGETTFALPDLQGRVPVHQGQGPGLGGYTLGETGGVEQVTLTAQQIPVHTHLMLASTAGGTSANPQANVLGSPPAVTLFLKENPALPMAATMVAPAGGSQPHDNLMPHLTINYILSLFGTFPSPT